MAHFAEIDENNIVLRVLVVPDEQEHRAQEYLANELGLGGVWLQCSYNNKIRKRYPGPGYSYDRINDVFLEPKPYEGWILDEEFNWKPPIPYPNDGNLYDWDERSKNWIINNTISNEEMI